MPVTQVLYIRVTKMCVFLIYVVSFIWCAIINSSGRQIEEQRLDEHESKAGQKSGFAYQWQRKRIEVNTEPWPAGITENSQKKTAKKPIAHELCRNTNYTYYMKIHFISLDVPKYWCSRHLNSAFRTEDLKIPWLEREAGSGGGKNQPNKKN